MLDLSQVIATSIANAPRPVQGPLSFNEIASALRTKDATGADSSQEIRESWIRGYRRWG
jgi:hypothetical protein